MMMKIKKMMPLLCLLILISWAWAQDSVDEDANATASKLSLEPKKEMGETHSDDAMEMKATASRGLNFPQKNALTPVLPQDAVVKSQGETAASDNVYMPAQVSSTPTPVLFTVSGRVKKAWLFGTMHVPDPRITQLTPKLTTAIDESDVVLTEARMNLFTETYMQAAVMRDDNLTLKSVLPSAVQENLSQYLRWVNFGGTIDNLNHMKVWAVYASISVLKKQLQYPELVPIDTMIYRKAVAANKIAEGIETVEEQVKHLENFTEQEQITLLAETLQMLKKDQEEKRDSMEEMLQWYLQGAQTDLKTLMAHILPNNRDLALEKKFMQIMFYDRNQIMAERIAQHFQTAPEKTYFIAIGAGHLTGENSIQDYLRAKGYAIERASSSLESL